MFLEVEILEGYRRLGGREPIALNENRGMRRRLSLEERILEVGRGDSNDLSRRMMDGDGLEMFVDWIVLRHRWMGSSCI